MPQSKTPESYPDARFFLDQAVKAEKGFFATFYSTSLETDQIRIEKNIRVVEAAKKLIAKVKLKEESLHRVRLPGELDEIALDLDKAMSLLDSTLQAADRVSKELSALSKATYFRVRLYALRNAQRKHNRKVYTPDQAAYNRTEWDILTFTLEFIEPGKFRVCAVHDDETALKLLKCESGEIL